MYANSCFVLLGTPDPVIDLKYSIGNKSVVSFLWRAPFSLHVTGMGPSLSYCLNILDQSSNITAYTVCGITETQRSCESFPALLSCGNYLAEVIAMNPVGNSSKKMPVNHEGT